MDPAVERGVIESFDDPRGIGVIRSVEGESRDFHCTAIADGTRTIAPGAAVDYLVVGGRRGRWEARHIVEVATS